MDNNLTLVCMLLLIHKRICHVLKLVITTKCVIKRNKNLQNSLSDQLKKTNGK